MGTQGTSSLPRKPSSPPKAFSCSSSSLHVSVPSRRGLPSFPFFLSKAKLLVGKSVVAMSASAPPAAQLAQVVWAHFFTSTEPSATPTFSLLSDASMVPTAVLVALKSAVWASFDGEKAQCN